MQALLNAHVANNDYVVEDEGSRVMCVGYCGFSEEVARIVFVKFIAAINATNVNYGNLFTDAAGYNDTKVTFTHEGKQHKLYTVYGA